MTSCTPKNPIGDRTSRSLATSFPAGLTWFTRMVRRVAIGGLALLAVPAIVVPTDAIAQTRPSQLEMAQLPRYCWGQYVKELAGQPGYSIQNCGGGMNHYCSGLTYMMRANKPGIPRAQKVDNLIHARKEIIYTLDRVTPNCPILGDIQLADQRLRVMETSVGIKPPK